jgi:hypothetical protein
VAKRGRPLRSESWFRNPVNIAAHYANVLLELWLADAPLIEIQALMLPLFQDSEYRALIEDSWSERALIQERWNEQRGARPHTVPPKIRRKLCQLAIAHLVSLQQQYRDAKPDIGVVLRYNEARGAAEDELKARGWTDKRVAAWFAKLEGGAKNFYVPDIDKVLEIVDRSAPEVTLRRKAADRRVLPK